MHLVARAEHCSRELRSLHGSSGLRALRREGEGVFFGHSVHNAKTRHVPSGEQYLARSFSRQREPRSVRVEDGSIQHEGGMVAVELHPPDGCGGRGSSQDRGPGGYLLEPPDRASCLVPPVGEEPIQVSVYLFLLAISRGEGKGAFDLIS